MILLLDNREENIKWFLQARIKYNQFLAIFPGYIELRNLKKLANFFKLQQSISILAIRSQKWLILVSVH